MRHQILFNSGKYGRAGGAVGTCSVYEQANEIAILIDMSEDEKISRNLTVARIREPKSEDYVEVMFLESARFYRLSKDNPEFEEIIASLRDAAATGRPVEVGLASISSDVIEDIRPVSSPPD